MLVLIETLPLLGEIIVIVFNSFYMFFITDINDCLGATCFHNATCIDSVNRFSCLCTPGFSGADCRLDIDECLSAPCHGGGTCIDMV